MLPAAWFDDDQAAARTSLWHQGPPPGVDSAIVVRRYRFPSIMFEFQPLLERLEADGRLTACRGQRSLRLAGGQGGGVVAELGDGRRLPEHDRVVAALGWHTAAGSLDRLFVAAEAASHLGAFSLGLDQATRIGAAAWRDAWARLRAAPADDVRPLDAAAFGALPAAHRPGDPARPGGPVPRARAGLSRRRAALTAPGPARKVPPGCPV